MRTRSPNLQQTVVVALLLVISLVNPSVAKDDLQTTDPAKVGMSSERLARIVPAMKPFIDDGKIPGVVTLVARRGEVVHFEATGYQNVAKKEPMKRDTIFRLYSQSKPVTGVAVMTLYEEGHFLLTDPVAKYLPEFSKMRVYVAGDGDKIETEEAKRPITIQHLLTHTSGLTYDFFGTPVARLYAKAGAQGAAPQSPHNEAELGDELGDRVLLGRSVLSA
jgi:CubicO group peptidase (beta-lactamase class C family)